MGFGMFSAQTSPIAVDFGSARLKLLQLQMAERPALLAAAEVPVPTTAAGNQDQLLEFAAAELPKALRDSRFKGKRVVCTIPSCFTFIQHMQVNPMEGSSLEEAVKLQLQAQMGCSPRSVVVRLIEVGEVFRDGQARREVICFAVARETVMKFVELLQRCRLEVVGVHTETMAMVRSFDHLHRRAEDARITTLYVEMGWSGIRVAVAHGRAVRFARFVPLGGRHLDQIIATALKCDLSIAQAHRLSASTGQEYPRSPRYGTDEELPEGMAIFKSAFAQAAAEQAATASAGQTTTAERRAGRVPPELRHHVPPQEAQHNLNVDLSEPMDTIADELSMSIRYHRALFPRRPIDRVIFLGGEARQPWLCQHVIHVLSLPAQMGDPLARLRRDDSIKPAGFSLDEAQPGWAVPYGLCTAPTDL
jgi:type IV pilus assembly protein PilM